MLRFNRSLVVATIALLVGFAVPHAAHAKEGFLKSLFGGWGSKKESTPDSTAPATPDATTAAKPDATSGKTVPAKDKPVAETPPPPVEDKGPKPLEKVEPQIQAIIKGVVVDNITAKSTGHGTIDVTFSLTNKSNVDDALVAVESTLSDKVNLMAELNGKDTPVVFKVDMPVDKTIKLSSEKEFVRISGIDKMPKDGEKLSLAFHFRRAANVNLDVPLK
jgi:copper(I)-binding protein